MYSSGVSDVGGFLPMLVVVWFVFSLVSGSLQKGCGF